MKRLAIISLLLLLVSHLAYSRSIREDLNLVSDGVDPETESKPSFLEWRLSAATETCEPTYGFLPCSTNVWGLLFLIVVYEILLSQGGKYVGIGSELFFQITGPGIFGASLFQFLGTIPQIVLVLGELSSCYTDFINSCFLLFPVSVGFLIVFCILSFIYHRTLNRLSVQNISWSRASEKSDVFNIWLLGHREIKITEYLQHIKALGDSVSSIWLM